MTIRALIFDFDGLILDTETPALSAWREIYTRFGVTFPVLLWGQTVGGNGRQDFDPLVYLADRAPGPIDPASLLVEKSRRERELLIVQPLQPGVRDALEAAQRLGLGLAIASSSGHAWVEGHLARLGLGGCFSHVLCREDVSRVKPYPELFRAALACLGVEPDQALVFEDSPNGVLAAHAAGVRVVGIPNPVTARLGPLQADLELTSLAEQPLPDLLLRFDLSLRQELPADIPEIRKLHRLAFGRPEEAELVDRLRQDGRAFLSLVTQSEVRITGHLLFSPVSLEPEQEGLRGMGLGPVAVLPALQRRGLGSRLIEAGLAICRERGVDFVVLLGSPRYYARFGLIPAAEFGLRCEYGEGDAFQALELRGGALRGISALVRYAPEFKELGI
jgi:HAD superfamily hydrolase (TIGR01509 family)